MEIKKYKLFIENVGDIGIVDYDSYNKNMLLSLDDKLFFIDKVDFDVIVDFGCADGVLLEKVGKLKPNVRLIGYDLDENAIELCKKRVPNALVTNNWNIIKQELSKYKNSAINLSSVIHEVYSYTHPKMINFFWNRVFNSGFKSIIIRDMLPSSNIDNIDMTKYNNDVEKVINKSKPELLASFERNWGNIKDNYRIFMHYLLKYRYEINWRREVLENYLPLSIETLLNRIKLSNYNVIFKETFIVPFIKEQAYKDFGIEMDQNTHTKLILKSN